jgi:ribosome recycling factor
MIYDFSAFKKQIKEAEEWLAKECGALHAGRASTAILDGVRVESYGSMMRISELATVGSEDARTLRITPWDASQVKAIEKALIASSLGVSVVVDDKGLRVIFPELTGERREQLVKVAHAKLEEAKKTVRADRDVVMKDIQALEKNGVGKDDVFRLKADAQKLVDDANKALEAFIAKKEQEIRG